MGDSIKYLLGYFFNASVKIWHKIIALIAIGSIVWVVDGVAGLSSFQFTDKKVQTLKSISTLLKDSTLPQSIKVQLQDEMIYISKKKSATERLSYFFSLSFWAKQTKKDINSPKVTGTIHYSLFWMIISSVGVNLLLGIWIILGKTSKTPIKLLLDFIILITTNFLLSLLIIALPSFWGDTELDKYLSNFVYQIGILISFTLLMIATIGRIGLKSQSS